MLYTIGELAKKLDIPTSTLRFYDKKGLLPFMKRSSGGMRMFADQDLECLRIVECLKRSGMSLKEIRHFIDMVMIGDATIDARLAMFRRRKEEVEKQIADLQATLKTIEYKCWYYEAAKAAGTTAVPDMLPDEQVPKELLDVRKVLSSV